MHCVRRAKLLLWRDELVGALRTQKTERAAAETAAAGRRARQLERSRALRRQEAEAEAEAARVASGAAAAEKSEALKAQSRRSGMRQQQGILAKRVSVIGSLGGIPGSPQRSPPMSPEVLRRLSPEILKRHGVAALVELPREATAAGGAGDGGGGVSAADAH